MYKVLTHSQTPVIKSADIIFPNTFWGKFSKKLLTFLKVKLTAYNTEYKNTRVEIEVEDIREAIRVALNDLKLRYEEVDRILVGYKQYEELVQSFSYFDSYPSYSYKNLTCRGCIVQIVPWFDGILVVPKCNPLILE